MRCVSDNILERFLLDVCLISSCRWRYLEVDVMREEILEAVVRLLVNHRQQFFILGLEEPGPVGLHCGRDQVRASVDRVFPFAASLDRSLRFFLRFCSSTTLLFLPSGTLILLLLLLLLLNWLSPQHLHDDRFLGQLKATHRVLVARVRYILTIHLRGKL